MPAGQVLLHIAFEGRKDILWETYPDTSSSPQTLSPSDDATDAASPPPTPPPSQHPQPPPPQPRASEVATSCNGLDRIHEPRADTNSNYEHVHHNGNVVNVHVVSESSHSIDVLSGGESDPGDTLSRSCLNNNSISSCGLGTLREARRSRPAPGDMLYYLTKELLLTERTYKSHIEVLTLWWSGLVSEMASEGRVREEAVEALGRPCLALEPLALAQAAFLAQLERTFASHAHKDTNEETEYLRVAELLYDYLKNSYDAYWCYVSRAGALVARLESARRGGGAGAADVCAELETRSPLPLAHHLLRPLHRLLHYKYLTSQVEAAECGGGGGCGEGAAGEACALATRLAEAASSQLAHAENHALLCQLQRDLSGFDKLLVPEREFLRLGCLYKHSSKGLQQRMFFLFTDVVLCCSKAAGGGGGGGGGGGAHAQQFRVHAALSLSALTLAPAPDHLYNSFVLHGEDVMLTLCASSAEECAGWCEELQGAIEAAQRRPPVEPPALASVAAAACPAAASPAAAAGLAHVCWHRATTLTRQHYHRAMKTQLSGYLLRKFKNSHGWQKLWVVLAAATLYFYKGWHEDQPLASLPLLGYSVGAPGAADNIHKEFVFKLVFKNHVYFFRADSDYSYRRWTEELRAAMGNTTNS